MHVDHSGVDSMADVLKIVHFDSNVRDFQLKEMEEVDLYNPEKLSRNRIATQMRRNEFLLYLIHNAASTPDHMIRMEVVKEPKIEREVDPENSLPHSFVSEAGDKEDLPDSADDLTLVTVERRDSYQSQRFSDSIGVTENIWRLGRELGVNYVVPSHEYYLPTASCNQVENNQEDDCY